MLWSYAYRETCHSIMILQGSILSAGRNSGLEQVLVWGVIHISLVILERLILEN
jgi:hypothetical protein